MVWRDPKAPNHSVSVFGRVIEVPQGDRNLIDFSLNAGVVLHAPVITRLDDTIGLGMGYTHVASGARGLDRDTAAFATLAHDPDYYPVRGSETYVEASYQYQYRAVVPDPAGPAVRVQSRWRHRQPRPTYQADRERSRGRRPHEHPLLRR